MADNFIKHVLMVESLKKSDREAPKTARQIQSEVESSWKKLFNDEPEEKPLSLQTIHRQVKALETSGLYKIKRHEDNKRGYYNADHLLSTAAASVLGAAIYQTASLSVDEKKNILDRLKSATDTDGGSILYSFERQIKIEDKPRETTQSILSKIKIISKAIVEGKQIKFNLRQNSRSEDWQEVTASPYFVIRKDDELYLTAKVCDEPKDFKLKLIRKIEIQEEDFQSEKNFSLRRHMNSSAPPIELKISFPESFIEKVIERFRNNKIAGLAPTGKAFGDERQFRATIFVGETEQLYGWFRQHCNKLKIHSPNNFKDNLILQLSKALETL